MAGLCFLAACNNDLFGLFGSGDLAVRLESRDSFKFLSDTDRTLSLGTDYSFIVLTDTHIEEGDAHGLERLASRLNGASFVVFTGDITQCGYREDVEKFIAVARSLNVPCYPVIGNHDVYFGNWREWKELIGSTRYRVEAGSASLFFLDSANAFFGKDQLDWLERGVKAARARNQRVFVFSHVNLFVESPVDIQQFTDTRERARITSMLKGRCDAMFTGHIHKRLVKNLGGVNYITIEDYRSHRTYCRVTVSSGGISWQFEKL